MPPLLRQILVSTVILFAGTSAALADPPSRVGRISYLEGQVSLYRPSQGQWSAADLNYPVVAGDSLASGQEARLEVQIGATEIRLDEMSQADLLRLDEGGATLRVDQGVANVHLNAMPPGGVQIVTPAGQVDLLSPGSYHIDAGHQGGGLTQVGVIEGSARLSGPRGSVDIRPGEAAQAGTAMSTFAMAPFAYTAFDNWAMARERNEQIAQSSAYVSPEMTGYQDLAGNGQWSSSPEYGAMWIPTTVGPDWAPYRFGHWAYVEPWGWTWIDDARWGFAPFHYGRWVQWHDRWAWCPGQIVERPVYAPALVAFIGAPGIGVNISVGNHPGPGVAWVPLGPREAFRPYYQTSDTYVRNVNISHVNNINNVTNVTVNNFINHRAMTVVPTAAFTGAAPINHAALPVTPDQMAHEQATTDLNHLRPTGAPRPGTPPQPAGGPGHPGGAPTGPQERPAPQGQAPVSAPGPAPAPQQMQPHTQPQPQPAAQPQPMAQPQHAAPAPQPAAPQTPAMPQQSHPAPQAQPQSQQPQAPRPQPSAPQPQQPHPQQQPAPAPAPHPQAPAVQPQPQPHPAPAPQAHPAERPQQQQQQPHQAEHPHKEHEHEEGR